MTLILPRKHCAEQMFLALLMLLSSVAVQAADEQPDPPFWRVTNAANNAYVFGSMHLGTSKMYPLPAYIREVLSRAQIIALEIDPTAVTPQQMLDMQQAGSYPSNESLRGHAGPERWAQIAAVCGDLTVDCNQLARFRPWFAAIQLAFAAMARTGFDRLQGTEMHVLQNKPSTARIVELESFEAQLALLSGFEGADELTYLMETVASFGAVDTLLQGMADAWLYGRDDALDRLINQEVRNSKVKDLYQKMIIDRNHTMADSIESLLRQQDRVLVVVGAAHVVGSEGLPQLLSARGWQMERVRP